jgi:mono/diheme cytochrome c family protein
MLLLRCIFIVVVLLTGFVSPLLAGDLSEEALNRRFAERAAPFLKTYCHACHAGDEPEAGLDLTAFPTLESVAGQLQIWEIVLERLEAGEMPPPKADPQPAEAARKAMVDWIRAVRAFEAQRNAGDPGPVAARRLSNAEYNYTVRDLTGVDIQPAREFPVDPANEAGFDNSGESLAMSPALMKKYLEAARRVSEHLVLKPQGFAFAPHPVVTNTDRDKHGVKRIIEFYQRQPTDLADYFHAAWKYAHRRELGRAEATLAEIADADGISGKYLAIVWSLLAETEEAAGPLATLQEMWKELPQPDPSQPDAVRGGCERMRDFVVDFRAKLAPRVENLEVSGIHKGSQPFVLWKNNQYVAGRRTYDPGALKTMGEPDAQEHDPDLLLPAGEAERARHEASLATFCSVFPDAFYISERGRDYLDKPRDEQEKGRLLSAGFHSMMGYFRDDAPLYDLVLDEQQQAELDGLWRELDFVTSAPMRQYSGFLWFERTDSRFMRDAEFDFARAEDRNAASEEMIRRLAEVYLNKALQSGAEGESVAAIEDYFTNINAQIRWVEKARLAAEPSHLEALLDFAERAYRRPLHEDEREGLFAFYQSLRQEELSHEEAMQDAIVSVLLSPHFCYRMDLAASSEGKRALNDYELAGRLSYFLWASMPDEQLLERAAGGDLRRPETLAAEARRMLHDQRIRGLATEFAGNWLDFRRFEEHNSVDRDRFPRFTDELRRAMFEEPIRYFVDLVQRDGSVLELLEGRHTFVNPVLAEHYGMPETAGDENTWTRIDDASPYGRGGLAPMAVFLTQNSPGLRTSPVKRGYWVVRRLLGEHIPPPPPGVPELPADEAALGELTLRETLARHREQESCAACHRRFDSIGLVFEGYGPIGERREIDLGGRPVDARAVFPDGSEGAGLDGLRTYLRDRRQEDFLDNLCRKLLSYALGRTLLPSDDGLLDTMRQNLAAEDYRFSSLIETIITSPQFLTKRGRVAALEEGER